MLIRVVVGRILSRAEQYFRTIFHSCDRVVKMVEKDNTWYILEYGFIFNQNNLFYRIL